MEFNLEVISAPHCTGTKLYVVHIINRLPFVRFKISHLNFL